MSTSCTSRWSGVLVTAALAAVPAALVGRWLPESWGELAHEASAAAPFLMVLGLLAAVQIKWRLQMGALALVMGVAANAIVVGTGLPMLFLPRGTWVRPMAWAALSLSTAVVCVTGVVTLSLVSAYRGERGVFRGVALAVALESVFVGRHWLEFLVWSRGIGISD